MVQVAGLARAGQAVRLSLLRLGGLAAATLVALTVFYVGCTARVRPNEFGVERVSFPVEIHEVKPEEPIARNGYSIVPFAADHRGEPTLGYVLVEEQRRGRFNPDLARELGLPVWRDLRRTRHGPPQASLPATARPDNVRSVFRAGFGCRRLRNRTIVLVDDVMTTGATVEACAGALLDAGVRRVSAVTVARALRARPAPHPR